MCVPLFGQRQPDVHQRVGTPRSPGLCPSIDVAGRLEAERASPCRTPRSVARRHRDRPALAGRCSRRSTVRSRAGRAAASRVRAVGTAVEHDLPRATAAARVRPGPTPARGMGSVLGVGRGQPSAVGKTGSSAAVRPWSSRAPCSATRRASTVRAAADRDLLADDRPHRDLEPVDMTWDAQSGPLEHPRTKQLSSTSAPRSRPDRRRGRGVGGSVRPPSREVAQVSQPERALDPIHPRRAGRPCRCRVASRRVRR